MASKLSVFILLFITYECNAGLIDGILGGAHEVAGAFLGGLSQNLNNIKGQAGFNTQTQGQQHYNGGQRPQRPGETIVVVVEGRPSGHDHNYGSHGIHRPNQDVRPYDDQQNHMPHHHHHHRPSGFDHNQGNVNYNQHGMWSGNPNQNDNWNGNPNQNGNWNGNPAQNSNWNDNNPHGNFNQINNNYPNQPSERPNQSNPPPHQEPTEYNPVKKPTENNHGDYDHRPSESGHKTSEQHINKHEKTTQKPHDEAPQFVPLRPNEYVYGGDKIDVEPPKRETVNKPDDNEDEALPIDIRIGD